MTPIRAVLFDLDDTLFDDTACTKAGLAELARVHRLTAWTPEHLFKRHAEIIATIDPLLFRGEVDAHGARVQRFQRLLAEFGVENPDGEGATHLYRQAYRAAWTLCDGAAEVLAALKSRGLKVGVLTNYVRDVQQEKLDHFGLSPFVDAFLCVEDVPAPKPDPRAYVIACERLGTRPAETLMVGDSWTNDVQGARNAGLRAVWVNRSGAEAARDEVPVIGYLDALLNLLN